MYVTMATDQQLFSIFIEDDILQCLLNVHTLLQIIQKPNVRGGKMGGVKEMGMEEMGMVGMVGRVEVTLLPGLFEKWPGNEARREVDSGMMEVMWGWWEVDGGMMEGGEGDGDGGEVGQ